MDARTAIALYPYEVRELKQDWASYETVQVTITQVYPGKSYGMKFQEDPNSSIWNLQGKFNDQTRTRDPYKGEQFAPGTVLNVGMKVREGLDRNTGQFRYYYDLNYATAVQGQPAPLPPSTVAAPAPPAQPQGDYTERVTDQQAQAEHPTPPVQGQTGAWYDRRDREIKQCQAMNIFKDVILSGISLEDKLEILKAMGYNSIEDAVLVFGQNWNALRLGFAPFEPIDDEAWDNPAAEQDTQAAQHLGEQTEQVPGW